MMTLHSSMILVAVMATIYVSRAADPKEQWQPPAQLEDQTTWQRVPTAPRTTTERVTDARLRAIQGAQPISRKAPAGSVRREYDIVAKSDFIVFDGVSTLVPKGAIIHVPKSFDQNIVAGPSGKLVLWNEFLIANRARIMPLEITVEEATGVKPVEPNHLAAAKKSGRIVVGVLHGHPTSVVRRMPESQASSLPALSTSR